MAGYETELVPPRAYVIIDEADLFQRGKLRLLISEVVQLVEVDGPLIYPWRLANGASLKRANDAVRVQQPRRLLDKSAKNLPLQLLTYEGDDAWPSDLALEGFDDDAENITIMQRSAPANVTLSPGAPRRRACFVGNREPLGAHRRLRRPTKRLQSWS